MAKVVAAEEVGRDLAARAEARVEAAVAIVAGQRELVVGAAGVGAADGDDLAVGLQRDRIGAVVEAEEIVVTLPPAPKLGSRLPSLL